MTRVLAGTVVSMIFIFSRIWIEAVETAERRARDQSQSSFGRLVGAQVNIPRLNNGYKTVSVCLLEKECAEAARTTLLCFVEHPTRWSSSREVGARFLRVSGTSASTDGTKSIRTRF